MTVKCYEFLECKEKDCAMFKEGEQRNCWEVDPALTLVQEQNLVAYIACLPRDLRFGLVKSLVKIPKVADLLCKDDYDDVILEAIAVISREAS